MEHGDRPSAGTLSRGQVHQDRVKLREEREGRGGFDELVLQNEPLAILIAERNRSRYDVDRREKPTNGDGMDCVGGRWRGR